MVRLLFLLVSAICTTFSALQAQALGDSGLRKKTLVGYQGWFRTPQDSAQLGWAHWSRASHEITPETLTFDLWPEMQEYPAASRHPVPGFHLPSGEPATLFSSDDASVVLTHFQWMQQHGIDGVWLQHFIIDFPGAPAEARYASRRRVLQHVRDAASATQRVWAITFDLSGVAADKVFDLVTTEWRKLVDEGIPQDPGYLKENGKPVVMLFGMYAESSHNPITAAIAEKLQAFFQANTPYQAFVGAAGDWQWRHNQDPHWHRVLRQFDAYSPWNVANHWRDENGVTHATTDYWKADKEECERHGMLWIPTLYPGFSWRHLKGEAGKKAELARRGCHFLWEQFHAASQIGADSLMIAMFDEVDEGTAIFKVTNHPPREAKFGTYEGLAPDSYLQLVGTAAQSLRNGSPLPQTLPKLTQDKTASP